MSYYPLGSFETKKIIWIKIKETIWTKYLTHCIEKKAIIILMYASFVIIVNILYFFRLWL